MSTITSLDKQVNQLIEDIKSTENLEITDLLKSKVAFQLTKIHFGLRLINRVMKLYDIQEQIEDRMLNEDSIQDLSMRELLVMSSVNSKRLDNYFSKMDKILGSINLRELEGSLLVISEAAHKQENKALEDQSESDQDLKSLSLQLLNTVSQIQDRERQKESAPRFEENDDLSYSEEDDARNLESRIDELGELEDEDSQ